MSKINFAFGICKNKSLFNYLRIAIVFNLLLWKIIMKILSNTLHKKLLYKTPSIMHICNHIYTSSIFVHCT